ncbi:MAG: hypothetical protein ACRD0W_22245 [Acidimicrobiales bacterium]
MSIDIAPEAATSNEVLLTVATSLERLAARVERDLDADAAEGAPPEDAQWVDALAGVVQYAQSCLAVLDEPAVLERLRAALAARASV